MQAASENELIAGQSEDRTWIHGAVSAVTKHWPEYLAEADGLGLFIVSACSFAVLLEHPASAVRRMLPSEFVRRLLAGVAMGATAIALIYSPWGKQSGAHCNGRRAPMSRQSKGGHFFPEENPRDTLVLIKRYLLEQP